MATVSAASPTGTLSTPGLGSGLDVQGLVTKLMTVEQQPLTLLATQEAKFQAKLTSLGSINGALASLQTAAQGLAFASTVQLSASASDTAVLAATAASDALPGKYSVTVNKLAQPQKLLAQGQASTSAAIGSGSDTTLTFTFGTITDTIDPVTGKGTLDPVTGIYANAGFTASSAKTPVAVLINNSNNTLAGIRDAINSANAGVTASIINDGGSSPYRLTITSNDTGLANSLKISSSDDNAVAGSIGALLGYDPAGTQKLGQTQAARNADISIDGVHITSSSNTVAGAIQGVTLNLVKETAANTPVSVTVQPDTSSITASLSGLVKAYNAANSTISNATAKGAVLQGVSAVLGLQRQVTAILGSTQQTGGAYTTLSSLGISVNKDGTLVFDTGKANSALNSDFAGVAALTAAIGKAIDGAATNILGPSGPISSQKDGIQRSITDIGSRRTNLQHRLDLIQQRYQKQFSALDSLLGSMSQTSTFLTAQLDGITNMLKK